MDPYKAPRLGAVLDVATRGKIEALMKEHGVGELLLVGEDISEPLTLGQVERIDSRVRFHQLYGAERETLHKHLKRHDAEVEAWNAEVDRKKAEKKARRNR